MAENKKIDISLFDSQANTFDLNKAKEPVFDLNKRQNPVFDANKPVFVNPPPTGGIEGHIFSSANSHTPTAHISAHKTVCTPDGNTCLNLAGAAVKVPSYPIQTNVQASMTHQVCVTPNQNPCFSVTGGVSKSSHLPPQAGGLFRTNFKF